MWDKDLIPIMAEFGGAVYDAQVLESGLSLLMFLTTKYQGAKFDSQADRALDTSQAEKTLGELFRLVQNKEYFTAVEKKKINSAIRLRNTLVHRFMTERSALATNPPGREKIYEELIQVRKELQEVGGIVESLIDKYLEEYGTNMEQIRQELEEYWVTDDESGSRAIQ